MLADAAGIEKFSSHPLSKSILEFIQKRGVTPHAMKQYQYVAGKGGKATCLVCNNMKHCIDNLKLIGANSLTTKEVLRKVEKLEKEGKTVVLLSERNKLMGALAIADKIKPESKETIRKLNHFGIETIMLTGDNKHTADFVARRLSIKNF